MLGAFLCKMQKEKWSLCVCVFCVCVSVHAHIHTLSGYQWESKERTIFSSLMFVLCYLSIRTAADSGMCVAVGCPSLLSKP